MIQSIENTITQIKTTRTFLLDMVKDLSIEQLNEIPAGFNNNIIWNLAHVTAAQQGLCYFRSRLNFSIDEQYIKPFAVGSKPEAFVSAEMFGEIKELMFFSLDRLLVDYKSGIFQEYTEVITRYGVEIKNIEEAINFLPFHEGMHMGYVMALKRVI